VTNSCSKQRTPEFPPKNIKKAKTHRKIDYERRERKEIKNFMSGFQSSKFKKKKIR
jgi:hypothetical protein